MTSAAKALVVIPTYNEAENIARVVEDVSRAAQELPEWKVDILVVDDGSPDGTAEIVFGIAEAPQSPCPQLHLLARSSKQGLGPAYLAGFRWGLDRGYDVLVEMDADSSHDPRALPSILDAIARHDFVVGSRYVHGGVIEGWSLPRRLLSRGGCLYSRLLLRSPIRDMTGGYNAWTANALRVIGIETLRSNGYVFQVELKHRAVMAGLSFAELPITFRDRVRGKSKMTPSIALEALRGVLRLRRDWGASSPGVDRGLIGRLAQSTFIRFAMVGSAGVVTNAATFYATVDRAGIPPFAGAIGAFAVAVSQNYVLNQLWSFGGREGLSRLSWLRYGKFVVSSAGALAVNLVVLHLLLHVMSFGLKTIPQVIGIGCGAFFNYLTSRYLVFSPSRTASPAHGRRFEEVTVVAAEGLVPQFSRRAADFISRNRGRFFVGYLIASTAFFCLQFVLLQNWDMLVRLLNAEYLFHGGYYFEPERALFESTLIGLLSYALGGMSVFGFILIGNLLLFVSVYRFCRVAGGDFLIAAALVLNPFFLLYGVMNGSEVYLLAFLLLAMTEVRRRSAWAGLFLALAMVSKYDALYFGLVFLFLFVGTPPLKALRILAVNLAVFLLALLPFFAYNSVSYGNFLYTFALSYLNFAIEVAPLPYFVYQGLLELLLPTLLVLLLVVLRGVKTFRIPRGGLADGPMLLTAAAIGLYIYYAAHNLMVHGLGTFRWGVVPLTFAMVFVALLLRKGDLPRVVGLSTLFFLAASIALGAFAVRSLPDQREVKIAANAVRSIFGSTPCTVYSNDWVVLDAAGIPAAPLSEIQTQHGGNPIVTLGRVRTSYPLIYHRANVYIYGDRGRCSFFPVQVSLIAREDAMLRNAHKSPMAVDPCEWLFGLKPRVPLAESGCLAANRLVAGPRILHHWDAKRASRDVAASRPVPGPAG